MSLALTLTAGAASGLAATPAWAVGGGITATIGVGSYPEQVAVSPVGTRAYVTNLLSHSVSVIDTATNQVIATIPGFSSPGAVAAGQGGAGHRIGDHPPVTSGPRAGESLPARPAGCQGD